MTPGPNELETPGWVTPFKTRKQRQKERLDREAEAEKRNQARREQQAREWRAKSNREKAELYIGTMQDDWYFRTDDAIRAQVYLLLDISDKLNQLIEHARSSS